jgi:NAD+ diphosphatase
VSGPELPAFESLVDEPDEVDDGALAFALLDGDVLVAGDRVPVLAELGAARVARLLILGRLDGQLVYAAELAAGDAPPAGLAPVDLRTLYGVLGEPRWSLAGRAAQLLAWDRDHAFCGRCGTATEHLPGERARHCPSCGLDAYPRLSPAVITVVERGDEVLLARGTRFPRPFYSALAGFVEPGESLEECVRREVREEVGIELGEIRYFGSQPWPFPNSLMIGFHADYASGELVLDPAEIVDAGWFRAGEMPLVPPPLSIARALIDDYLRRQGVPVGAD